MLSLKEKLYRLDTAGSKARKLSQGLLSPDHLKCIQANTVDTPVGKCVLREKRFDLDFLHGQYQINSFLNISQNILKLVSKQSDLVNYDPFKVLFIDTETTGLAGGTGTFTFIIGVGFFTDDEFMIQQFFLNDFNAESAQLFKLAEILKSKSTLVSFNGKTYDIPLLKSRFILNRIDINWDRFNHIDLLHACRRLWGKNIGSCTLQNVEKHILKLQREGDIPGSQIPQLYFNYLLDKNITPLIKVFKHNAIDILSLVSIAQSASELFQNPLKSCPDDTDFNSVLRTFLSLKQYKSALDYIETLSPDIKNQTNILKTQALLYKKLKDWENALGCYKQIIRRDKETAVSAYVEIAKIYEHRLRQYEAALAILEELETRIHIIQELYGQNLWPSKEFFCRKTRLHQKNQKQKHLSQVQ